MSVIALEKWKRLLRIFKQHGGLRSSLYKMWRFDTLKEGKLVGCDGYGNKYYENNFYMIGRNRWVEHNIQVRWDYDATQVTPEWFGWLHHKTDRLPCHDPAKIDIACNGLYPKWMMPHEENCTATNRAYVPYSTTPPKIHCWDGSSVDDRTQV